MFSLFSELTINGDNSPKIVQGLKNPDVMLDLSSNYVFNSGNDIENLAKSRNIFRINFLQNGIRGGYKSIPYGISEILFDIPYPSREFTLEIIPGRLQFDYGIKIFQRIKSPLAASLAEKWGLSVEEFDSIPQHTLQILERINLMAISPNMTPGDTRTMRAVLKQLSDAQAQTNADLQLTNTTLTTVQTEMLISEQTSLASNLFVLQPDGLFHAVVTLQTIDGTKGLDFTVVDASGDAQGFVQVIHPYMGDADKCAIELDAEQKNGANFPLSVTFQGRKPAVAPTVARQGVSIGNGEMFSLVAGSLARMVSGAWSEVSANVTEAKYRNGRVVFIVNNETANPRIIGPGTNWLIQVGSSNDWNPDENNSPLIPA